jgi:hypothetical protein
MYPKRADRSSARHGDLRRFNIISKRKISAFPTARAENLAILIFPQKEVISS